MKLLKEVKEVGAIEIMPVELVEFSSAGRLLLIGSTEQINTLTPELTGLQVFAVSQPPVSIEGYLGKFTVELAGETITVDLVLDLLEQTTLTTKVLPLGYFAPSGDEALASIVADLPDLVGDFDKPRYFDYKASRCAHSNRQVKGCSQCVDACPAEAITSKNFSISINPSLCQGCGSCAAVCPSGAMTYVLPSLDVSINRLRMMMKTYFELETKPPQLIIHDLEHGQMMIDELSSQLPEHCISFSIEEIGALSMPFWLSALAYGVSSITVLDAGSHADHDWLELQQEITKTNQLLTGLSYADNTVNWCATDQGEQVITHLSSAATMQPIQPAEFGGVDDKRRMITIALGHLHKHAPEPIEVLALSNDAAFGEIKIDTQSCTLCMSCVSVCPVGAVLDGGDKPQLNFIEDLCVQCGMCETACPENSISLVSQYVFDREQTRKVKRLHEEPIFHCISCNKGFATQKMIDTMITKLSDHPMFQGDALDRLKMCEDCRVKAIFKDTP
ncbi:MAG: 4Fe-4S ferredoxin [Gammaproteobacteria bacterium]|nr:MAG: 4Fe-4S ferredoxin [Gammaproteobacteria bacterium]